MCFCRVKDHPNLLHYFVTFEEHLRLTSSVRQAVQVAPLDLCANIICHGCRCRRARPTLISWEWFSPASPGAPWKARSMPKYKRACNILLFVVCSCFLMQHIIISTLHKGPQYFASSLVFLENTIQALGPADSGSLLIVMVVSECMI